MDRSTETDRCGHFPDKFHGDTSSIPSSIRRRLLLRTSNHLSRKCQVPSMPILDPLVRIKTASVAVEPSRFTQVPSSSESNSLHEFEPTRVSRDGRRSIDNHADGSPAVTSQTRLEEGVVLAHDRERSAQTTLGEANENLSELERWLRQLLPMLIAHRRENGPVAVDQTGNDTLVTTFTDSLYLFEGSYSTAYGAVPSSVVTSSSRKRERSIDAPDPELRGKHRRQRR